MKQPVPEAIHTQAVTIGKQLEQGHPWRKLGGRRQRTRRGERNTEKPPIVFKLSDDYRLYCWFKSSLPVRFQIVPNVAVDRNA